MKGNLFHCSLLSSCSYTIANNPRYFLRCVIFIYFNYEMLYCPVGQYNRNIFLVERKKIAKII